MPQDNWYCTLVLFRTLVDLGFNAVGTVRANRGFPVEALFPKSSKGFPMGSCAHLRTTDGKILLVGWFGKVQGRGGSGEVCRGSSLAPYI